MKSLAFVFLLICAFNPAHADTQSYEAGYDNPYALPSMQSDDYHQGINDAYDQEYAVSISQWNDEDQ